MSCMSPRRMPMEVVYEDLARQNIVAHLSQLQLGVSPSSHMGFNHRRGVLGPLFWTLHGLLRYQLSSACFALSVCLSITFL